MNLTLFTINFVSVPKLYFEDAIRTEVVHFLMKKNEHSVTAKCISNVINFHDTHSKLTFGFLKNCCGIIKVPFLVLIERSIM